MSQSHVPITPEAFWREFSTRLGQQWQLRRAEIKGWYDDKATWTAYITEFLREMGSAFRFHVDCEYWPRVDVSYFDRCSDGDWGEWSREVAIEHENGPAWTEEVCKLMEINAGLKVLIAYAWDRNIINSTLSRLPRIHQSRKYVTTPCNFLFIFGPSGGDLENFTALKFDGSTITDITGDTKIIPE